MSKQLFYDDVEVNTEVAPLAKVATTTMLVKFAGAIWQFSPIHYDDVFASTQAQRKLTVPGRLKQAWLAQMMTDWIGEEGFLKKLACFYIKTDYPRHMKTIFEPAEGETWWCKGKITKKYSKNNEHYVECDIWVENGAGEMTAPGSATVILPSRK